MIESMLHRRTVRKYAECPVDDALLRRLLEAAERTQTMGNLQLYSVVVTRSEEGKSRLAPLHFHQPMCTSAPVVLTFCADFHRTTEWARHRDGHPGYDNALSFLNAATDALLYCQNFCTLAEDEGLGLCFLGTTIYNAQGIIDALRLPPLVFPVATITLGWKAEEGVETDRLPLSAILHEETYQPVTATTIERDYAEKEAREDSRQFVAENGLQTLAQVFTDVRYKKADNEAMSQGLLAALWKQVFLNE